MLYKNVKTYYIRLTLVTCTSISNRQSQIIKLVNAFYN